MSTQKGTIQVNGAGEATMTWAVSRDGTQIAYWTSGEGPPLVLVHGTTADHTRWRPLLPYLEPLATVHAIDRRGRGASGDAPDYHVGREFEDVAAVIDAVAEASGSAVDVLGHSFGGLCAFGGAALTPNTRRLVLYEGWPSPNPDLLALPPGVEERLDARLAEGDREAALETFFREVVKMPEEEFVVYRALPAWQARIAAAHTITREFRAQVPPFDPEQAAKITVPTLMLVGGDSPDFLKAGIDTVVAALPDAHIVVIEGQQHIAIDLVPEVFAEHVVAFLRDQR
jgi:pimeloyl-ACP methyl ester carboxylesterase